MKKLTLLILALCLILWGCGGETAPETTAAPAASATAPVQTNPPAADPGEEGFTFDYNGTHITLNAPAAPIVEALGEPKKYTESASCAFEGLDKNYYYGSFYLDTYPMGEEDFVFGWWFADDSVSTPEGIYIGATQAQVEAAYGADAFNGTNAYILRQTDGTLTVILEDGVVSSIQYSINLE